MKRQTLYLVIGTAIMLVASIVMIIIINATTTDDPVELLFGMPVELKNETNIDESPGGQTFSYIDYKTVAYDKDDQKVGDVYNVKIKNAYALDTEAPYGVIELLVGIDVEDLVYVSIVELDQSTWTVMGIQAYINETFNGIPYLDVETLPEFDAADPTAGATATDSTGTIKQSVLNVIYLHYDVNVDPYDGVLGDDYVTEVDTTFTSTTHVTSKLNITTSTTVPNGTIYVVTGSGEYYDGSTAAITLWVIVDENDHIFNILMPEDLYGHSPFLHDNNLDYLDGFIGDSFADITITIGTLDGQTGASNTNLLIQELLTALASEVSN